MFSAFFLEFFFERRADACGRAERFAVVVERKAGDVERERTGRRLLVDDDGHGTAFDAVTKGETAAAGETRVGESLQHLNGLYYLPPEGGSYRKEKLQKSEATEGPSA
jgi:hypothetical protein